MAINYDKYTGKQTDGVTNVFEEEVKKLLVEKDITSFSSKELLELIESVDINIDEKHQIILDTIRNLPSNQNHNLSLVKNIMTMDGRLLMHHDKIANHDDLSNDSSLSRLDTHDLSLYTKKINNDPRKNPITMSKLVKSGNDFMTPIFKVVTDSKIKRKDPSINYGKLLLEVRISTPLSNFKGFITTGMLDNKYGIGFFSDYNRNIDGNQFFIIAHKGENISDDIIEFSLMRRINDNSENNNLYDDFIPINIQITPLIHGEKCLIDSDDSIEWFIKINQSLSLNDNLPLPSNYNDIYGIGNLNNDGHGPIDCVIEKFESDETPDFSSFKMICSKYYPANRGKIICKTSAPVKNKRRSKFLNLRIQPSSFDDNTTDTVVNSHILKPTHGRSNFDMYNLLKKIYNFENLKPYRCFGNIIINNLIIPVMGFVLDYAHGRVSFTISPYFTIPSNLKSINGVEAEFRGMRIPIIVFDTNINVSHSYKNNGFIGDVDGESDKFHLGYDTYPKNYNGKTATYDLSMVDLTIEIPNCNGSISEKKWGDSFRYSGDFNKYTHDFTKHDYDSYPFPGEDRNINDEVSSLDEVPSLNPESLILATSDNGYVFVWVDNNDDHISYSSNNSVQS